MKPPFLIAAAAIAVIGVAAIAFAASGEDRDDTLGNNSPPATETPMPVEPDGGIGATPGEDKPMPVEPDGGIGTTPGEDKPIPVEPDGGIGTTPGEDKPIPVEPDGGIGTTPGEDKPIPVEPDGGNGASPNEDTPMPVEPDSGIGNSSDQPVSDKPIPSEPVQDVTPAPANPTLPDGRYAEHAPIEGLDLTVAESFPPQYYLKVTAGLPSGCAEQYTYSFQRSGNHIQVEVLNSFPKGNPACTAIYGIYEVNIALGMDFTPGQTYTIDVNDGAAKMEFTAQ